MEVADLARFKNLLVKAYEAIRGNPGSSGRIKYGASETVTVAHGLGVMPVDNYSRGVFEKIKGLIAETMREKIVIHR